MFWKGPHGFSVQRYEIIDSFNVNMVLITNAYVFFFLLTDLEV